MQSKSKTLLITGGGGGIGQAIAFRFASMGANIIILSKESLSQLKETIEGIETRGGKVLTFEVDVSEITDINEILETSIDQFGGLDILINNTTYPCFKDVFDTTLDQFDLVMSTSIRPTFILSKKCYPYLKKANNPHIINISPPFIQEDEWLKEYLAFSLGKYGMSLCTKGLAASFYDVGIAVNSLWPKTNIATERLKNYLLREVYLGSRLPSIMADAIYELTKKTFKEATGQFFIDEELLKEAGVDDFSKYAIDSSHPLVQTLFLPLEKGMIPLSKDLFK